MSYFGIDTSYAKPTGAELRAAGVRAAMLYITPPGPGNKGVTQAVYDDYDRHGILMGFVWEEGAEDVLKGYNQGVVDARAAQANLHALKGPADTRPIYFGIDFDIQPAQYAVCSDYFKGAGSVLGWHRVGGYGHAGILNHLTDQRLIDKRWVAAGWQYHGFPRHIDIVQYRIEQRIGSGDVDFDRFYSRNWGQKAV